MKLLLSLLFVLWSIVAQGQSTGIPNRYMNDPAVDLTRNGKLLMPDEVHELKEKSRFDISILNPTETTDLWKNVYLKELPQDKNPLNEMDEVNYHSPVISPSGIFRFNIQNNNGDGKLYTMMLSKNVHTVLLAKNLLRKIGYQIPDIKYLPKIILNFKSKQEKLTFVSYLENVAMAGAAGHWIVEHLGDNKILIQDLIVMDANHIIYNLAVGVTPYMIQGRRLLSSLAVPLTIVNLEESVNMLRWTAGMVNNKHIVLFHNNLDDFQCTWDDARWAARRIEKLTRADWKDIVESTQIPKAVQQVLLEKIISRRNSIMKLFKIDSEQFKVDSKINNGIEIVDGKVTQQKWPGYASRFAHGDPDSPLSDSDMQSWVKSRAISTAMELALSQINQLPFMGTDIAKINEEKFEKQIADATAKSVANKTPMEIPVKAWVFPTFRGQLIFNRNLVTGTYLGTDNLVQLVDTVGVAIGGGVFAGTMGIKVNTGMGNGSGGQGPLPVNIQGGAEAMLVRTYAHLRPVFKLSQSLKYPFRNIFVPLVKMDYGKKLHEATQIVLDPDISTKEKEKKVEAALAPFKNAIAEGESLLVTDSLATNVGVSAGVNVWKKLFSASLGVNPSHIVVSRFHVHRKSEHEFQIYKDIGHKGSIGVNFGVDSLIPILKVTFKKSKGDAKVKFFNLNLDPKNPNVLKNASALRKAIVNSSTGEMEDNGQKPFVVKHNFKESTPSINLLFWQFHKQNSSTDITVTNPKGEERYFRRHYYGSTQGRNYQAYVNALISHWVGKLFDKQAGLSDATGTNPGYSFKGRAKTKYLSLDQEVDATGTVIEPFIRMSRIWNGWSIDKKKAEELLEEMRDRYRFAFYEPTILNDTLKIYLYNVSVNMLFYQAGIEHLMGLSDLEIKRIFIQNKMQESLVINPNYPELNNEGDEEKFSVDINGTGVNKFLRFMKRFKKYEAKGKEDKANKYLLKALSYMEEKVYLPGIVKLMGGDENIYVYSKIEGFREGDEDGDRPITSNSLGEFGSPRTLGPVMQVQRQSEMLEGEFFINWMMQRLI